MEKKIIAIANGKGGVAKTTTTFQVGWTLANMGFKTLVVDCDAQCNLTQSFAMENEIEFPENIFRSLVNKTVPYPYSVNENLSVVIANPELCNLDKQLLNDSFAVMRLPGILAPLKEYYDYILLDCPPNLDTTIVRGCIYAADYLVVPISGDYSLRGRRDMISLFNLINSEIKEIFHSDNDTKLLGYLMTRSYPKQIEWKKTLYDLRQEVSDNLIFSNIITERAHVRKCQSAHIPVSALKKTIKGRVVVDKGVNECVLEFSNVTQEIIDRIHWLDSGEKLEDSLPESCQERTYKYPEYSEIEELIIKQEKESLEKADNNLH